MGSYFDSLKDELKTIRNAQEGLLVQMGLEPIKDEAVTEEKEKEIKTIIVQKIEVSSKRKYLTEDLNHYYDVKDMGLDSNKRFLQNDQL